MGKDWRLDMGKQLLRVKGNYPDADYVATDDGCTIYVAPSIGPKERMVVDAAKILAKASVLVNGDATVWTNFCRAVEKLETPLQRYFHDCSGRVLDGITGEYLDVNASVRRLNELNTQIQKGMKE